MAVVGWGLLFLLIALAVFLVWDRPRGRGGLSARVIADSVNPNGDRLTTIEAVFNRYLLAEFNTHRMLSRNSASSRAIPVARILRQVWSSPSYPISWGANQAGMQARGELVGWRQRVSARLYHWARLPALVIVWTLSRIGLHKQVANRLLEPWVWHTVVVSATEWENFFKLRLHPDAQPEFQELARRMKAAMDASTPQRVHWSSADTRWSDAWHLPYVEDADIPEVNSLGRDEESDVVTDAAFMSAARCAAVSYVRQGERRDVRKDIALSIRLRDSGHWSPFEHPAVAQRGWWGNFRGWKQLRKFYPSEESGRTIQVHGPETCPDGIYGCPRCA